MKKLTECKKGDIIAEITSDSQIEYHDIVYATEHRFYLEDMVEGEDIPIENVYYTAIGDRLYMPVENIDELLGLYKVGFLNGGINMKRQFREFLDIK
jgi:hypothetical protein